MYRAFPVPSLQRNSVRHKRKKGTHMEMQRTSSWQYYLLNRKNRLSDSRFFTHRPDACVLTKSFRRFSNAPTKCNIQTRTLAGMVIGLAALLTPLVQAQTFPSKALRIIVPFPAGGAADVLCRVLAENMSKGLGQTFLIENRPGAQSIVGYEYGARAPADGTRWYLCFRVLSSIR